MTEEKANNLIEKLKQELESINDEGQVSKMNFVIDEIDKNIIREKNSDVKHVEDLIRSTVREFEASHPKITAILNDFLNTLSSLGI